VTSPCVPGEVRNPFSGFRHPLPSCRGLSRDACEGRPQDAARGEANVELADSLSGTVNASLSPGRLMQSSVQTISGNHGLLQHVPPYWPEVRGTKLCRDAWAGNFGKVIRGFCKTITVCFHPALARGGRWAESLSRAVATQATEALAASARRPSGRASPPRSMSPPPRPAESTPPQAKLGGPSTARPGLSGRRAHHDTDQGHAPWSRQSSTRPIS